MKRWMRAGIVFAVLFLFIFMVVRSVQAAQFDQDGVVGPTQDDVFVANRVIAITGPISGTVIAVGNRIEINNVIEGDVIVVGSSVTINTGSEIKGNLFALCSELQVSGTIDQSAAIAGLDVLFDAGAAVARNLYFGGYSLSLQPESVVGKDLLGAAYQLVMRGTIDRNVKFNAGAIEVFGTINGNANFNVSAPGEPSFFLSLLPGMPTPLASGIRVYSVAKINGTLAYASTVDQNSSIRSGQTPIYITPVPQEPKEQATSERPATASTTTFFMTWLWAFLRRLITFLILGALALWLLPKLVEQAKSRAERRPLPTAGVGLLTIITGLFCVIAIPILFVLAGMLIDFITLGGLNMTWFGVVGMLMLFVIVIFFFLLFFGSILTAAYALGDFIVNKTVPQVNGKRYMGMLVGVAIFVLVRSAPYVGWIFGPIACVVGMGAIWLGLLDTLRSRKQRKGRLKL
jgi:hypothetical protein